MGRKRHSPEEVINKLRQADVGTRKLNSDSDTSDPTVTAMPAWAEHDDNRDHDRVNEIAARVTNGGIVSGSTTTWSFTLGRVR